MGQRVVADQAGQVLAETGQASSLAGRPILPDGRPYPIVAAWTTRPGPGHEFVAS